MVTAWRSTAQCQHHKPELFDPVHEGEGPAMQAVRVRVAAAICNGCPSKQPCYAAGRTGRESGVWGGVLLRYGRRDHSVRQRTDIQPREPRRRPLSLVAS